MKRTSDELLTRAFDGDFEQLAASSEEERMLIGLKQDLRALREVPECQLSTERMRRAVLSREIHARKARPLQWLYVGVPAAAACMLLALTWMRPSTSGRPMSRLLADKQPVVTVERSPNAAQPDTGVLKALPKANPVSSSKGTAIYRRASAHVKRSGRRIYGGAPLVAKVTNPPRITASALPNPTPPLPEQGDGAGTPRQHPSSHESDAQTLVVISSDQDSATGARRAAEISQPSTVIIGG